MVLHHEDFNTAITTYTLLTIGDGLISQLPALLVSTATGIIVTRANSEGTFGHDVTMQFSQNAKVYLVGAAVLLVLALLPGFPWYVLIPMAAMLAFIGVQAGPQAGRRRGQGQDRGGGGQEGRRRPPTSRPSCRSIPSASSSATASSPSSTRTRAPTSSSA